MLFEIHTLNEVVILSILYSICLSAIQAIKNAFCFATHSTQMNMNSQATSGINTHLDGCRSSLVSNGIQMFIFNAEVKSAGSCSYRTDAIP